jgi:sporulation protein YlmC with PRC-barrel domain
MFRLMQGASALTLAAVLAMGPLAAAAQTATDGGAGTDLQTGTGAPAGDQTAQDSVILPQDGAESDTETAQTDPLAPAPGSDPLAPESDAGTQTAEIDGDATIAPIEGTIQMQDQNTFLASDMIGARIYNAADDSVGTIDDIIVSTEGTVEGVVIGVGGFLGIGRKLVAVEMSQISVHADAAGNPRLLLDATREALEAAPEFVTAAQQAEEADRLEMDRVQPTQGMTGAGGGLGTGTAPPAVDQ